MALGINDLEVELDLRSTSLIDTSMTYCKIIIQTFGIFWVR